MNNREFAQDRVTHVLLTVKNTINIAKIKEENFFLRIIRSTVATNKKRSYASPNIPPVIQYCRKALFTLL